MHCQFQQQTIRKVCDKGKIAKTVKIPKCNLREKWDKKKFLVSKTQKPST